MAFLRVVPLVVVLAFLAGVAVGALVEDGAGARWVRRATMLEGCPGFAVEAPPVSAEEVHAVEVTGGLDADCNPVVTRVEARLADGSVCVRTDGRVEPPCDA